MPPERTCVGCRTRAPQEVLARFVVAGDRMVPATKPRLAGRGAYLHRSRRCLDQALKRRALQRALRTSAAPDPTVLEDPGFR